MQNRLGIAVTDFAPAKYQVERGLEGDAVVEIRRHVAVERIAGVLPVDESRVVCKWRLQPGKMLLIDLEEGRIVSDDELKARVFDALANNVNYQDQNVFGVPASQLDEKVFQRNASFLKDSPFLSTLMENPNHIGCHTLDRSEPFFEGTQESGITAFDLKQGGATTRAVKQ